MLIAALQIIVVACNLPGLLAGTRRSGEIEHPELDRIMEQTGLTLHDVLAAPSEDHRPETLELLGAPDAFTLQWQELQGQTIRWEEWSYFDFGSRFDFVDGELVWTLEIDPAPSGSLYAHAFNPLDFEAGMSMDRVKAMLPELAMAEIPLNEADIPAGVLLAGDQILLGFDDGMLVYVQTFILEPEEPLTLAGEPLQDETPAVAPPGAIQEGGTLLLDTFDSPSQTAVPIYGSDVMGFSLDNGIGTLTAHHGGILVTRYDNPLVQDFAATLVMRAPHPQPNAGYGLLFRGQADAGGIPDYYMLLAYPADGMLRLHRWAGTSRIDLAETRLPDAGDIPFTLHVEVAGKTIYAEVNETPTLLAEDNTLLKPGILGLVIHSPVNNDSVLFDELRVEALGD